MKPNRRPRVPHFSSGPAAKRPGWTVDALGGALVGRSHRSAEGKARLQEVIERTRAVAGIPASHRIAIVPGSDTGAVEMAMWSLLGSRGVDVLAWESFGQGWVQDIVDELRLKDVRRFEAEFGALPDLSAVDFDRDVVLAWNGTTSGVIVPHGEWIPADRTGLTICDATSAAMAVELPWDRLDVITWSWQKLLGGEAAHGILVLGPRAVSRLESTTPPWPMPKLYRMTKKGKLNAALFEGETINTPSMLCVEDALDALRWAESIGGGAGMIARTRRNFEAVAAWVERTPWIDFLAADPSTRSPTSVCLRLVDPEFCALPDTEQRSRLSRLQKALAAENAGHDLGSYRDAPPGLRLWCGATVETDDLEILFEWLDWGWDELLAR